MNLLVLYDSTQTYTNTVYEHIASIAKYSSSNVSYCAVSDLWRVRGALDAFDAVAVHYSIRLPYDQVAGAVEDFLRQFNRLKILFIQDEYEHTFRAWHWIKRLGFQLVFTAVPAPSISKIYPPDEFHGVAFVNTLTGYVPESLPQFAALIPPSERSLIVAYRGRPLPVRFGALGADKVRVGELVKAYCLKRGISHDIAWSEEARIYGPDWYEFMGTARSMLGTESGSNVFDWNGTLESEIASAKAKSPGLTQDQIYEQVVAPREMEGAMNQISPRVFEAIALRTVLVLFEGSYSGVLVPGRHYLSLKRDGSNLDDVFEALSNGSQMDLMAARTYDEVVGSGRYSYENWIRELDMHLADCFARLHVPPVESRISSNAQLTNVPIRALPPEPPPRTLRAAIMFASRPTHVPRRLLQYAWWRTPEVIRTAIRKPLRRIVGSH